MLYLRILLGLNQQQGTISYANAKHEHLEAKFSWLEAADGLFSRRNANRMDDIDPDIPSLRRQRLFMKYVCFTSKDMIYIRLKFNDYDGQRYGFARDFGNMMGYFIKWGMWISLALYILTYKEIRNLSFSLSNNDIFKNIELSASFTPD